MSYLQKRLSEINQVQLGNPVEQPSFDRSALLRQLVAEDEAAVLSEPEQIPTTDFDDPTTRITQMLEEKGVPQTAEFEDRRAGAEKYKERIEKFAAPEGGFATASYRESIEDRIPEQNGIMDSFEDASQSFWKKAGGVWDKLKGRVRETEERYQKGEIGYGEKVWQNFGSAGLGLTETAGEAGLEAVKAVLPESAEDWTEEKVRSGLESTWNNLKPEGQETLKTWAEDWKRLEEENPNAVANVRPVMFLADVIATVSGGKVGVKAVETGGKVAKTSGKLAKEGIEDLGGGIKQKSAKLVEKRAEKKIEKGIVEAEKAIGEEAGKITKRKAKEVAATEKVSELERKATADTAQLLRSGSKKTSGRVEEFSKADKAAMKAIRDSDAPLKSQQDLVEFFDTKVSDLSTKAKKEINRVAKKEMTGNPHKNLQKKAIELLQKKDMVSASKYNKVLQSEKKLFARDIKALPKGKATAEYFSKRLKEINTKVSKLYDDAGGKLQMNPEEKAIVQAYEELRRGYREELGKVAGKNWQEANAEMSGLIDAKKFSQIQRERAKNALQEVDFMNLSKKDKIKKLIDYVPYVKELGKGQIGAITRLDTMSDVLDAVVEPKIRQIRASARAAQNP